MRGALPQMSIVNDEYGIIPAYAGSTNCKTKSMTILRDHPRVCGEHRQPSAPIGSAAGSSPRMRGARNGVIHNAKTPGIIPAYAGSTADS